MARAFVSAAGDERLGVIVAGVVARSAASGSGLPRASEEYRVYLCGSVVDVVPTRCTGYGNLGQKILENHVVTCLCPRASGGVVDIR